MNLAAFERGFSPFEKHRDPIKLIGGRINTEWEERRENLRINLRRPLPQVRAYPPNPRPLVIVGGGPSVLEFTDKIKELRDAGAAVCAVNNMHNWLQEKLDIIPSAYVAADTREMNKRFVETPQEKCKYFLHGQCNPSVYERVANCETYIWHTAVDEKDPDGQEEKRILDGYYMGKWTAVAGGSTSLLRAFLVMRILGYGNFHVFGFDSCYLGGEHHAYPQPENDNAKLHDVMCLGKKFVCAGWQIKQYEEFVSMFTAVGHIFRMEIYGDGLPAHLIRQLSRRPVQMRLRLLSRIDKLLGRNLRKKYCLEHDADIEKEESTDGGPSV